MKLFKNKKITVMGLGLNGGGVGVAKFFCKQGADVLVTDLKTKKQLAESIKKLKGLKIKYVLGGHKEEDFTLADLIVKNPDVPATSPYLEIARKNNVPVETDLSLFFKLADVFTIGVTGTKGKSTTSSLIYHLLKSKSKKVFLAGNIGVSPLEFLPKLKKGDRVVLELSSFALEGLKKSPNIAVVTNIMPDHLNRYGTMEEYIKAKKIIFKYQSKQDYLVLNNDDSVSRDFAREAVSKVVFFSKDIKVPSTFRLFGSHNLANLSASLEVAKLLNISRADIEKSLKTFKGVPNRQEFIKDVRGVKYFNDTASTMPDSTITAIDVFSERFPKSKLIFICGGMNKNLEYLKMAQKIKEKVGDLVMLPGAASDKIKEYLNDYKNIYNVSSMKEAVKKAKEISKKGDIVVLSPGCTSFNLFKNEFDRGDKFVAEVKKMK